MNKGELIEAVQKNLGKDTTRQPQKPPLMLFRHHHQKREESPCSNHRFWNLCQG